MLVRGRKNSLNFVEASENTGVIVYPIRQLFEDGSNDVVVYRKLMYKLDEETQRKFKRRLIVRESVTVGDNREEVPFEHVELVEEVLGQRLHQTSPQRQRILLLRASGCAI